MDANICLITGANGGIGYETTRALANRGSRILMVARHEERGMAARQQIVSETGAQVDLVLGDLSSIDQTKHVVQEIKTLVPRLDVLVNNAGGAYARRTVTREGLEDTFALNFLAPFVLTLGLLDLLQASAPARIVNVTSSAHKAGRIDFDDLQHERKYSRMRAYADSKLALTLFSLELARRLVGTTVTCNCVNPGFVATRPSYASRSDLLIMKLLGPFGRSPEEGAIPTVFAATAPELDGVTGRYFDHKCRKAEPPSLSQDRDVVARLWDTAIQLSALPADQP